VYYSFLPNVQTVTGTYIEIETRDISLMEEYQFSGATEEQASGSLLELGQ
jgi:hypothetical protein